TASHEKAISVSDSIKLQNGKVVFAQRPVDAVFRRLHCRRIATDILADHHVATIAEGNGIESKAVQAGTAGRAVHICRSPVVQRIRFGGDERRAERCQKQSVAKSVEKIYFHTRDDLLSFSFALFVASGVDFVNATVE